MNDRSKVRFPLAVRDFNADVSQMRFPGNVRRFVVLFSILAGLLAPMAWAQTITSSVLLVSSPNPAVANVPVTFTAEVRTTGTFPATGTMTFYANGNLLGTASLDSTGTASFTTTFASAGSYSIRASYSGDGTYSSADSALLTEVILANFVATTTVLTSSVNPSTVGQTVSFTANIELPGPNRRNPTGTVTFCDGGADSTCGGGTTLGTVKVITFGGGEEFFHQATLSTSTLTAGPHQIQAFYSGDNVFAASASAVVTQVVQTTTSPSPTTTTLISSLNPSTFGQAVTFTATVTSSASGLPTGMVQFSDGASVLGTAALDSNAQAAFTTSSLPVGIHAIQAAYGGDTNFDVSSGTVNQQVDSPLPVPVPTTVAVTASDNQPTLGESITLTATVTPTSGTGIPTGIVTFILTYPDNSSLSLGIVALDQNGTANVTTSLLAAGANTVTANYGGDAAFVGNSGRITLLVNTSSNVATTTVLASSANPSPYGLAVTFRATVSGSGGTPTGSVDFTLTSGAETLASATSSLDDTGQAIFTVSALPAGTISVTAVYSGDAMFAGSTGSMTQTVSQASTTVNVTSSKNPANFGASITFTATVSSETGAVPTGSLTFQDESSALGQAVTLDENGTAQLTVSTLTAGQHNIAGYFSGDMNFLAADSSSAPLLQTINPASTTITVSSSSNSITYGTAVTFTAVVIGTVNAPPTGTVDFRDGALDLGSATLDVSGRALLTLSSLSAGPHNISAYYFGDANFLGSDSSSSPLPQTVTPAGTTTSLTSSLNPASFGTTITFAAVVMSSTSGAPTGTVTFQDGTSILGSSAVGAGGAATLSVSTLAVGSHSIFASYSGDSNFQASDTASTPLMQTVTALSTTTTVSSSANPSVYGQTVSFTATIGGSGGTPAGTVVFTLVSATGSISSGPVPLSAGAQALFATSGLPAGTVSVTAAYSGNGTFTGSTSSPLPQSVNRSTTTTVLTSSSSTVVAGTPFTLTAVVTSSTASGPSGSVSFRDQSSGTVIGSAAVGANGHAALNVAALPAGSYSIVASYSGDANFQASSSAPLVQSVVAAPSPVVADLAIVELDADRRVEVGDSQTYAIIVINLGPGTANAVRLSDALPAGTTFLRASSSSGMCTAPPMGQTGTLSCSLASLPRYSIWSARLTVRVTARAGSTLSNTVIVTSSTPDPKPSNNSATVTAKVVSD